MQTKRPDFDIPNSHKKLSMMMSPYSSSTHKIETGELNPYGLLAGQPRFLGELQTSSQKM